MKEEAIINLKQKGVLRGYEVAIRSGGAGGCQCVKPRDSVTRSESKGHWSYLPRTGCPCVEHVYTHAKGQGQGILEIRL